MKPLLRPSESLIASLTTIGLVYGIFTVSTPNNTDIREAEPNDDDVSSSNKTAAWMSGAVVCAVSLLAKDPTIFTLGGATVVALYWWNEKDNLTDPVTGRAREVAAAITGANKAMKNIDPVAAMNPAG